MAKVKDQNIVEQYIQRTETIRRLSAPSIVEIEDAEEFCSLLQKNFEQIGILAEENRKMLDRILYPRLDADNPLPEEETEFLSYLSEQLVDAYSMKNLDVMLEMRISEKLLSDATQNQDLGTLIKQLDAEISASYTLMNMTKRISFCSGLCEYYRERGLQAAYQILQYVKKENFSRLPDVESRKLVLINSRYISALYEDLTDRNMCEENLRLLRQSLLLAQDPFYRDAVPDYDWNHHTLRTLEYFAMLLEQGNARGFNEEQRKEVLEKVQLLKEFWQQDPAKNEQVITREELKFFTYRAQYLAGVMDLDTYKHKLRKVYNERNEKAYDLGSIFMNMQIPVEYLCVVDPQKLSEREKGTLEAFYRNSIQYAHRLPNGGSLIYLLEYFTQILERFIEIPGGINFEEMCLNCLGALHPPSYIHSMMVGKISRCLCEHLINKKPELFLGMLGCNTEKAVVRNRDKILSFTYHAAVCHDVGKIPIIDTIFVYGRKLMEEEFNIIKQHPTMGAYLLSRNESTKDYADIALLHHRWYDQENGYPLSQNKGPQKYQRIIDIVTCADCLDAATDKIGRSYNVGKSLSDFVIEVEDGSGTRYAPYLADLLQDKDVQDDLSYLLNDGRLQIYRNTYILLKDVQEHSGMHTV